MLTSCYYNYIPVEFVVDDSLTIMILPLQNESGKFELRFLFVDLNGYPKGTIVIEDNR